MICHSLDVAAVARVMWDTVVADGAKHWFAAGLGVNLAAAGQWVVLLAALHDIGKASPAFQRQSPNKDKAPHDRVSAAVLKDLLQAPPLSLPRKLATELAVVVGGHHGFFPQPTEFGTSGFVSEAGLGVSGGAWPQRRRELMEQLLATLGQPAETPAAIPLAQAAWLAGFISVADWIGSNDLFFPYAAPDGQPPSYFDPRTYAATAAENAKRALATLGWQAWPEQFTEMPWADLFAGRAPTPNRLQSAVQEIVAGFHEPGCIVIEAPMGEGKTEAALWAVDQANVRFGMRGFYLALPTQATSNQMLTRAKQILQHRVNAAATLNLQLLHGHAVLSDDFAILRAAWAAMRNGDDHGLLHDADEMTDLAIANAATIVAPDWFAHRKRGLLAPVGVGTVDQILMSVLPVKHGPVRMFGLAAKTVVIDEVHAYDAYMSTLLERLLAWLGALRCNVVVLSATLPVSRRNALLAAYRAGWNSMASPLSGALPAPEVGDFPVASYPRVSWFCNGMTGGRTVKTSELGRKVLNLVWIPPESTGDHDLVSRLRPVLVGGGCVAVICNTVRRAQRCYQALAEAFPGLASDREPVVDLLHARFPFQERDEREKRAIRRFGPRVDGEQDARPKSAILVATQVIEQSLDLDFDLMITDLAPVDLLLQRSGRMHRHRRSRPALFKTPALWVLAPEVDSGLPEFEPGSAFVYAPHVLLRTWLELRDRTSIAVPEDIEALIERVYRNPADPPDTLLPVLAGMWRESSRALHDQLGKEAEEAQHRQIQPPSSTSSVAKLSARLYEEDSPDLHPAFQALTRLTEPTIEVICLFDDERGRTRLPGGGAFNPAARPTLDQTRDLMKRSLRISGAQRVRELGALEAPTGWSRNALLRHCRLLRFQPHGPLTDDVQARLKEVYRLDPRFGLVIGADARDEEAP